MLWLPLIAASVAGAVPGAGLAPPVAPGPRAVDQGEGPIALPDREALLRQLARDTQVAVDGAVADLILSATTGRGRVAAASAPPREDLLWRLGPLPAPPGDGAALAGQTAQTFGSEKALAVQWRHEVDGSATLSNAFGLRHASGPVDTQLAVIGRLSLLQGGPMALSYRSSTTIALLPHVAIGADAHGPLGTLSDFRPGAGDSMIEPRLRFTVPMLGATAGATTGWRLPTSASSAADRDRRTEFHWQLTLRKKL